MYSMSARIISKSGLHARPAASFVREASKYTSSIMLSYSDSPEKKVNAKSIMPVLSMAIKCGDEIRIVAEGEDEKDAVESLIALVNAGLGE